MKPKKIGEIIIRNWPAKILSLALAVFLFYFYKINTTEVKYMSIPLEVNLSSGFIAAENHPSEVRVTLRGTSESISLISERDISAYADFTSEGRPGLYRQPVRIRKAGNALYADPLEIRVEPAEIFLRIEEKMGKVVVVEPVVKGFPAENYELVSYGITPETLSIEGPASVIEKINTLKTETISIDGRNESFNLPVKIELAEEKVVFPGGNEVQFRGRIEKSLIIKSIAPVEILMENSDSSMVYELEVHSGSLRVEAERTIIDFLDRENCSLYIDMQNVTSPGVYNLPVNARLPEMEGEIKITGIAPETVRVYVTRNRRY